MASAAVAVVLVKDTAPMTATSLATAEVMFNGKWS